MSHIENLNKVLDPLQLLKDFAVHAPVGIQIYDATGHSVFTNEQHTLIFGGPPPPGMCVLTDEHVAAAGTLHLIHKAFAGEPAKLPLLWYDPRELKQLVANEVEYVKQVGKKAAIETHMVPVFDKDGKVSHVVFIFKDVTGELFMQQERERALKERDDAKTIIQSVLDQTRAVIYIKDLDGKTIFANGQYCRIFEKTLDQILGKTDHELFPKSLADDFRKNDLHVQNTREHLETEEVAVHADGKKHTYLSLKFPVEDSTGSLYGTCGISTDITQFRMLERELSTAKRMESVGLLAGGIAHDFNNILEVILLVADTLLIKGATKKPDWRTTLESIKNAANGAALLTRQLLAFGQKQESKPRNIDIGKVILNTKDILSNALGEDICFSIDIVPDAWPVHVDPTQIEQILTNLCFNARDAMPKGGNLSVTVSNKKASVDGNKNHDIPPADFVELSVFDDGLGIDPNIIDRIFEPFFTTKRDGQGTGLGLSTVYGIVQSAGGEITVESTLGKGTAFRIQFPKAIGPISENEAKEQRLGNLPRGTETILLVEDQVTLRNVTANLLRELGYTVIEARNGKAALDLWGQVSHQVDLVMTDIIMPGLSGLEMAQKMAQTRTERMSVLFVSGYSEKKLSDHRFNQGSFHFIEKPYTAGELLEKLRSILEPPGKILGS